MYPEYSTSENLFDMETPSMEGANTGRETVFYIHGFSFMYQDFRHLVSLSFKIKKRTQNPIWVSSAYFTIRNMEELNTTASSILIQSVPVPLYTLT